MSPYTKAIYFMCICLVVASCASLKPQIDAAPKLDRKKTTDLLAVLDSISIQKPALFYSKINTNYKDQEKDLSFKTSLRMVKDTAMTLMIKYANIPIVNSLITFDTLKVVDKKNKCYIKEPLTYLKESFGFEFNYKNLEEIFLGLPLDYDIDQKYFQFHDPFHHVISSLRKSKIKRTEKKAKESIVIKYYINRNLTHLQAMDINSPSDSTEIHVEYLSRELVDGYLIPKDMSIAVKTPRNSIFITLEYTKVRINEDEPLFLVIPEGYEKCD
jgi:hypothetical protein